MIQDHAIGLDINPTSGQVAGSSSTWNDTDRVVLADVKRAWTEYQSTRERSAVYPYLHMVFMQVDWWARNPLEKDEALRAIKRQSLKLALPEDPFAAVIACTADPKKEKVRSKWTRVLRYAAKYKPDKELLRDFLQRKGGINSCAARYARRLGRKPRQKGRHP